MYDGIQKNDYEPWVFIFDLYMKKSKGKIIHIYEKDILGGNIE